MAIYKNPITGSKYLSEDQLMASFNEPNTKMQVDSMGITPKQICFNSRNRLPLNTKYGKCVISGKTTNWNPVSEKYERFHSDVEREEYRRIFKERMKSKYGKEHLLDDPNRQRYMLSNRSISETYIFKDGSKKTYTGKEELALLKYLNEDLEWPGEDIHCPAPQNFYYKDGDKSRFYIPDVYIESINLIVEVKGEMHDGYRSRDAHLENAKDDVLKTSSYNYIKVEAQDYTDLDAKLEELIKGDQNAS